MTTITERNILDAANDLVDEGIKVTNKSVRDRLGGGSYQTINPVLKTWSNTRADRLTAPDAVRARLIECADDIWTIAKKHAAQEFSHSRAEYQNIINELQELNDTQESEVGKLGETRQALTEALTVAEGQINDIKQSTEREMKTKTDELSDLRVKIDDLHEGHAKKIESLYSRIAGLEGELGACSSQRDILTLKAGQLESDLL